MKNFKVISLSHKNIDLKELGKFVIEESERIERISKLKTTSKIDEIFYLATCNRIEFYFATWKELNVNFLKQFFRNFNSKWNEEEISFAVHNSDVFENKRAIEHFFRVASSLESLVIGEKEIFGQLRKAYNLFDENGFIGETLRFVMKSAVKTSKEVFSQTCIAQKPVSIVSLAFRQLKNLGLKNDSKFLIVGAGETNNLMAKYLQKHCFNNFSVFNRTLEKAELLAKKLNGKAHRLSELRNYSDDFDVILTCTGASEPIISEEIYSSLVQNSLGKKVIIDLAVPGDVESSVLEKYNVNYIDIKDLKSIAKSNMLERKEELETCEKIVSANLKEFDKLYENRKIEIAMKEVPQKIKEIKSTAVNTVFAKEIDELDENTKELFDKVLNYMEKKCISVPMVMAKTILSTVDSEQ